MPECKKCKKSFTTREGLRNHLSKRVPCDKVHICNECGNIYKYPSVLKKHRDRKTTCKKIKGDPTKRHGDDTCRYCMKKLLNKYAVERHYKTCEIKNGNMTILFTQIDQMQKQMEILTMQLKNQQMINTVNNTVNNTTNNNIDHSNHFNTNLNINISNFDDINTRQKVKKAAHDFALIASTQIEKNMLDFTQQRVEDCVTNMALGMYRNPDHKELQGIYVKDPKMEKNNAFIYSNGKWHIRDWSTVSKKVFNNMNDGAMAAMMTDNGEFMKSVLALISNNGLNVVPIKQDDKKITDAVGHALSFDSIIVDNPLSDTIL